MMGSFLLFLIEIEQLIRKVSSSMMEPRLVDQYSMNITYVIYFSIPSCEFCAFWISFYLPFLPLFVASMFLFAFFFLTHNKSEEIVYGNASVRFSLREPFERYYCEYKVWVMIIISITVIVIDIVLLMFLGVNFHACVFSLFICVCVYLSFC